MLVFAAIMGIGYVSVLLAERFSTTPMSTVVESVTYPVAEIPFPAVTICNYNRMSLEKAKEAAKM